MLVDPSGLYVRQSLHPKVLLVGGEERSRSSLFNLFSKQRIELVPASSEKEALELLSAQEFALIFFDLQTLGIEELTTLRELRALPLHGSTPILISVAGSRDSLMESEAYKQGVADILFAPLSEEILLVKLRVFVDLSRSKPSTNPEFVNGAGEMAKRVREHEWAAPPRNENTVRTDDEDLRKAANRLARLNEELETLFRSAPAAICYIRRIEGDLVYEYVNPSYEKLIDRTNLPGRKLYDVLPEFQKENPELSRIIERVANEGQRFRANEFKITLDWNDSGRSTERFLNLACEPVLGAGSRSEGLTIFALDVTDQVLTRKERKEKQLEFERNIDVSPAMLWITEKDGTCSYLSQQWYAFTGQTEEEALGFGWLTAIHPEDKARAAHVFRDANEREVPFYVEYRVRTTGGDYHWAIDAGNPRYDASGNYLGYAGTVFDIHEQKVAAERLRESERNFRVLFESAPGLYLVLKPDFTIAAVSDAYTKATLTKRDEILNRYMFEVFPDNPDDPTANSVANLKASLNTVLKTKTSHTMALQKYDVRAPNGRFEEKWWSPVNSPVIGSDGNVAYIIHRAEDVTEFIKNQRATGRDELPDLADGKTHMNADLFLRAHEIQDANHRLQKALEDLRIAKEEAERANQLKSAFLANMSHEIRTPLGAMIGFADLLRDPGLTETERSNYIDILSRNGEQLSVIINDILDLSKVEAGHLTLEFIETNADQIATDVVSLLRVKAKEKDLALEYVAGGSTPASVVSDPVRVRQVLLNLVSNAVKFTQFGSVKVQSYGIKNERGHDCVCFEVEDTGIGIPEAQLDRIFEVFVQADNSMTRRFGGTGLGLALSRRLARTLGGDVTILKTAEGKGTTFLFTFEDQPAKFASASMIAKEEKLQNFEIKENALDGVRILVVDDAPDNQQLIWRYLTKRGALVDSAENGYEGYKKALSSDFDVVLMDIQMPMMDGYTATQKLRSAGFRKPIIALTAHAMPEVRRKCMNVGCTDHLSKPINSKELIHAIAWHMQNY